VSNEPTPLATPVAAAPQAQPQVAVDDHGVAARYVNFCRVSGTPEELILDFGLNANVPGGETEAITATERVVTNYYTAKRLYQVLAMTIQRHEAAFGIIEVNVEQRLGGHGLA
jgi:hypothetical protein